METAMANVSSGVYAVLLIIVLSYVVGNVGVGHYVRRKGASAGLVKFISSLATVIFLLVGIALYLNS